MQYYLIVALQAFCIYHVYKNKNEYYWFFIIIFLPVLGSLIYLIVKVYNRRDADKIQEGLATIINPTKRITDLERTLEFSETFQNKVNLADAYLEIGNYKNAVVYYEAAINDGFQNDLHVIKQLIKTYSSVEDYEKVVIYAEKIKNKFEFRASHSQLLYGLALEKLNRIAEAEEQLRQIDIPNANYTERLVYARFLLRYNKKEDAKELLQEIQTESEYMIKVNRRKYNNTVQEVNSLLKDF
jgi:hypothetical protein